ncbi:MAG: hypothetical protein KBH07_14250 [Flavobacteriales bacterium]|nr:hypothetical protein [Flavobacteriales bacterium]MBP9080925.1 hypothetical protein [Flavobacteriales bacterium]
MEPAIPLPDMGHRWLERAKSRFLSDPATVLVLEHSGVVTGADVPVMVAKAEDHSRHMADPIPVRKRMMQVLVEAVDNLNRHGLGLLADATFALLVQDRHGYRLATGNAVPWATAMVLSKRVEILNMMAQEDLKEQYLKLLTFSGHSANGGAGLGLFTLARKGKLPLVASFDPVGPFTSYFTLEMRIGGGTADLQGAA